MYGCFLNDGYRRNTLLVRCPVATRGQLAVGPLNRCGSFLPCTVQQEINRTSFSTPEVAFFMRALLFPWNAVFLLQLNSQGSACERHVFFLLLLL